MAIKGMNRILEARKVQFDNLNEGNKETSNTIAALSTLAENQKIIYKLLEDINSKLDKVLKQDQEQSKEIEQK